VQTLVLGALPPPMPARALGVLLLNGGVRGVTGRHRQIQWHEGSGQEKNQP